MADPQSSAALRALSDGAPRAGVIHVRHRHTDRFTVVGNHLAQHKSLSATAIGLAVHIQSLPDGASVTAKALTLRFREGEITIRRALNELEDAGYLARTRVALGGGRIATRTLSYEKPGCVRPAPEVTTPVAPEPPAAPQEPAPKPAAAPVLDASALAVDVLAGLRVIDPRLLLSRRDVQLLAPEVDKWLALGSTPSQITRALTGNLPTVPIHHPARILEYRLTELLPHELPCWPRLPAVPADLPVAPMRNCDGCERVIRTDDPDAYCLDCRPAGQVAA